MDLGAPAEWWKERANFAPLTPSRDSASKSD
jgi:hypothetical protein